MRCGRSAFRLLVLGFRPSRPFAEESSGRITAKPKYSGTCLIPCSPTTVTQQAAARCGYQFTSGTGTVFGTVNSGYTTLAKPNAAHQTGIRAFCGEEDGVVRVDPAGACSSVEATILTFNPLNQ
jgi:hypothetical protein